MQQKIKKQTHTAIVILYEEDEIFFKQWKKIKCTFDNLHGIKENSNVILSHIKDSEKMIRYKF